MKSNSHVEFVCQVWGVGEVDEAPLAEHYGFGTLVGVELDETVGAIVGVIFDTILHNPEFGSMGPRLMPATDSLVLAPDRLGETAVLAGLLALGRLAPEDAFHGVGPTAPRVGATVRTLSPDEIREFHLPDGMFTTGYVPHLLAHQHPLVGEVLLNVADQLTLLFPEASATLAVVRDNLAWQMKVLRSR